MSSTKCSSWCGPKRPMPRTSSARKSAAESSTRSLLASQPSSVSASDAGSGAGGGSGGFWAAARLALVRASASARSARISAAARRARRSWISAFLRAANSEARRRSCSRTRSISARCKASCCARSTGAAREAAAATGAAEKGAATMGAAKTGAAATGAATVGAAKKGVAAPGAATTRGALGVAMPVFKVAAAAAAVVTLVRLCGTAKPATYWAAGAVWAAGGAATASAGCAGGATTRDFRAVSRVARCAMACGRLGMPELSLATLTGDLRPCASATAGGPGDRSLLLRGLNALGFAAPGPGLARPRVNLGLTPLHPAPRFGITGLLARWLAPRAGRGVSAAGVLDILLQGSARNAGTA
mmetsp:Transcript_62479/g.201522  ORF Transcript_62479/g.201522 Transcript_62479/m.201522 type:complete len:358 (-) Transcript_62479:190-1263(-)